jgi:hypothetical protein
MLQSSAFHMTTLSYKKNALHSLKLQSTRVQLFEHRRLHGGSNPVQFDFFYGLSSFCPGYIWHTHIKINHQFSTVPHFQKSFHNSKTSVGGIIKSPNWTRLVTAYPLKVLPFLTVVPTDQKPINGGQIPQVIGCFSRLKILKLTPRVQ